MIYLMKHLLLVFIQNFLSLQYYYLKNRFFFDSKYKYFKL